ncbi:PepSY domain-containing protein [Pseudonocardia dioxanivorans]|uniref:PepSY domain-containing protein n=1 Tax=Pseudonocardia dioxanivorans TaxID=240495 RepID=UPI000CD2F769|nr:PepSY domain-containing protein [Pseudonocardia dioxanivorans]
MTIRRPLALAAATGVALLALTGTALALGAGNDDRDRGPTAVPTSPMSTAPMSTAPTFTAPGVTGSDTALVPAGDVDRAAAERAALAHVGSGQVVKVEREVEHGRTVWDVDVRTETGVREVHVDAATGAITRDRAESSANDDDPADRRGDGRRGDDDPRSDDHGRGDDHRGSADHHGRGGDDGPGDDRGGDD